MIPIEPPDSGDELEEFWDAVLSRQPERVRRACAGLDQAECDALVAHLRRMCSEEGWHPEQRRSARAALEALGLEAPRPTGTR